MERGPEEQGRGKADGELKTIKICHAQEPNNYNDYKH